MAKIYVASSWRNVFQQDVVDILRNLGHEVYDFKNPPHGNGGFQWSDIDLIGRTGQQSNIEKHLITQLHRKVLIQISTVCSGLMSALWFFLVVGLLTQKQDG